MCNLRPNNTIYINGTCEKTVIEEGMFMEWNVYGLAIYKELRSVPGLVNVES